METVDFSFSFEELHVTLQDMLDIAPAESMGLEDFIVPFEEVLALGHTIIQAKGGYRILEGVVCLETGIRIGQTVFETGKIIARPFQKAEKVALFVCTAGPGIRKAYEAFMAAGDPLKAFIADTLGTVAVEKAMDKIQHALVLQAKQTGLHCTNRYSPGYCGWPVSEQQQLWSLLPENYCGIRLSESSLMIPVKSVSGIIGIGANVHKSAYACAVCELGHCIYRRKKHKQVG